MSAAPDLERAFIESLPRHYDERLGPAWFGKLAARLALQLPPDPGGDVLEIACGTGLLTQPLRERLDPHRMLFATDLNPLLVEYAHGKLEGVEGIYWQKADGANLPFDDAAFAAVACSFGVMFVADRAALFGEARRVLQPGGRFLFNMWDRLEENPCLRACVEALEGMLAGEADALLHRPHGMHDEGSLRALLAQAGFAEPRIEKVRIAVTGVTALDIATGQVRGTPVGLALLARGIDLDAAIAAVAAAVERATGAGAVFHAPAQALAVEAMVP
jgi:SAM-dependent methyltransferase